MERRVGVAQWCLDAQGPSALDRAKELGFSFVHLAFGSPEEPESPWCSLENYRKPALGIGIGALALDFAERLESLYVPGTSAHQKARELIDRAVEAAMTLGVSFVYWPCFGASAISPGNFQAAKHLLMYFGEKVQKAGVRLALENNLSVAENQMLLSELDDHVQLLFDIYNPVANGQSALHLIDNLVDKFAQHVHVKDGYGPSLGAARLGSGDGDVKATLTLLRQRGYVGEIVLENDYSVLAVERVKKDISFLASIGE